MAKYDPSLWTFCIVTPSYNQAQFLEETVASVLGQKGQFNSIYRVQDGGSGDGSVTFLKTIKDKQFSYISEKDKGQTDAINKGIAFFGDEIVANKLNPQKCIFAYINSDDVYLDNAFETVLSKFQKGADWVVGDCEIISQEGSEIQSLVRLYKKVWRALCNWQILLILNPIPQPATFIKFSTLQKVGLFNDKLQYVMDYEYWLRLWKNVGAFKSEKKPLAKFRIHGESKGGSQFEEQFEEEVKAATSQTNNKALLSLHKLHSRLIVWIYNVIKN